MNNIDISTKISAFKLNTCIMNASGALCMTEKELNLLNKSCSSCIVSKTCTFQSRCGNPEPRYYSTEDVSINSMGLPNKGFPFYLNKKFKKPYIISLSPMDLNYFEKMINYCYKSDNINGIEINLSCPNVVGKSQIGYDINLIKNILSLTTFQKTKSIGLKLPPYFDTYYFEHISKLVLDFDVNFLTCINTLGNGLIIDPENETTVIKPKAGLGGIGGSYIKPIALANVYQFKKRLPEIDIIGCGGIRTGKDIFEHILTGASAVQIGTTLVDKGVGCFKRLEKELKEIMKEKGYNHINDFKGKLKVI